MSIAYCTTDMVSEVRSLLDEFNEVQLDTNRDIIPSLFRALERANKTLSNVYPDPLLFYIEIPGPTTKEVTLPETIFEDKIVRVEWYRANEQTPKISHNVGLRLMADYTPQLDTPQIAPAVHMLVGRKIRFCATPNGAYNLRIWAIRATERPVLPYGRIAGTDSGNTLFITDVASDFDPSTLSNTLAEYVNLIDGQTGEIKGSMQILSYDGADTVVLKSSPDRSTVLNRTISGDLSALNIQPDDYLCSVTGSCVMYMFDMVHTFVIQSVVAEMKRKLGYAYDVDQKLIDTYLNELRQTFMGRESKMRINLNNPNWMRGSQRKFYRGFRI